MSTNYEEQIRILKAEIETRDKIISEFGYEEFKNHLWGAFIHDESHRLSYLSSLFHQLMYEKEEDKISIIHKEMIKRINESQEWIRSFYFLRSPNFNFNNERIENINSCVKAVVDNLTPILLNFEFKIKTKLSNEGETFFVPCASINKVITNLLLNAYFEIQYSKNEERQITIEIEITDIEAKILISQNDAGINPDDIKKIWLPAFASTPTINNLGLFQTRNIVTALGGRFYFEDGESTKFVVAIPKIRSRTIENSTMDR